MSKRPRKTKSEPSHPAPQPKPLPESLQPRPKSIDGYPIYQKSFADEARSLSSQGASESELAQHFQVTRDHIRLWRVTHPEFSDAIKIGEVAANTRVEQALLERAIGYTAYETREILDAETGEVKSLLRVGRPVAADVAANKFWSTNRNPERWKDKVEIEHGGEISNVVRVPPVEPDAKSWAARYAPPETQKLQ